MDTAKNIFLAISIILLAIGAWPIALLTSTVCLTLAVVADIQKKKEFQTLQAEVRKLREDLERLQTVQRVVDKADNREKG